MLDLKTISIIVSFETLFFGLIVIGLNRRHKYAGIDAIGTGMALTFFAGLLMSMQGVTNSLFSIVGFGVMTVASMSLINYGLRIFLGKTARSGFYYLAAIFTFFYCYYFSEIKSDYLARVAYFSMLYFIIFTDNFRVLFFGFKPEIKKICRFTGLIFLFLALLFVSRGFLVFYFPQMRANYLMDTGNNASGHYFLSLATIVLTLISLFLTFVCVMFMMVFRLEAQLQSKTDKLAELNGDRDRFFSIIAHDLVSPLSNIPGLVKLLINGYDTFSADKIKDFLLTIHSASARVYSLLDNLITWSRASMGRMPFEPDMHNLYEIAENAIQLYEEQAKLKSLSVTNKISKDHYIFCDGNMTRTIMRNLIANAIKFCVAGGRVDIGDAVPTGGGSAFFVKDNGAGMKPDTLNKLFKAGERINEASGGAEKGNGIGLLIVKELVDKHDGKISVESTMNEGSVFTVEFPPAPAAAR